MIYKLEPIFTYNLWGGYKLSSFYHIKKQQIGEAWIMSCLNGKNSKINKNKTLLDVFNENKNIVKKGYTGEFPLLIKLIDAEDNLSIQVHPKVKTEFWHILNETPSKLYMGFNNNFIKSEIREILNNSEITKTLNHIQVNEGDSYLIKPGTIHAIGKGTFLIEIQRSADVTYRLYDFDRVDKDGNKRELHINQGLSAIKYNKLEIVNGPKEGQLVSCPFFKVYRYKINNLLNLFASDKSFHSIVVINGYGILTNGKEKIKINRFDSLFVPASSGKYQLINSNNLEVILTTL